MPRRSKDLELQNGPIKTTVEARADVSRNELADNGETPTAINENPRTNFWKGIVSEAIRNFPPLQRPKLTDEENARSLRKVVERAVLPKKMRDLELENKKIRQKLSQQKKDVDLRLKSIQRKKQTKPRTVTNTFKHSEDYRWVYLRKQQYRLTSMQAQVIGILHKAFDEGKPELGMDSILAELDARSSRLRDIFRSRPGSYRELVKQTSPGVVRLNL